MWWTPDGERVVSDSEWLILRTGTVMLWDFLKEWHGYSEPLDSGVPRFDALTFEQQAVTLAMCLKALRDPAIECPDLTAQVEATIAAIFESFAGCLLELDNSFALKQAVLDVWKPDPDFMPENDDDYYDAVEECADCILWDRDLEIDVIEDAPPNVAKHLKRLATIQDDYFTAVVPEPTPAELGAAIAYLDSIGRSVS